MLKQSGFVRPWWNTMDPLHQIASVAETVANDQALGQGWKAFIIFLIFGWIALLAVVAKLHERKEKNWTAYVEDLRRLWEQLVAIAGNERKGNSDNS